MVVVLSTVGMGKPEQMDVHIRNVPRDVWLEFHAAAVRRDHTVRELFLTVIGLWLEDAEDEEEEGK